MTLSFSTNRRVGRAVPLLLLGMSFFLHHQLSSAGSKDSGPVDKSGCNAADALRKAGKLELAINRYENILNKTTEDSLIECAGNGLLAAVKEKEEKEKEKENLSNPCRVANRLREAQDLSEAKKLYKEIVKAPASKDEAVSCANEGLQEVAKAYLALGQKLQEEGDLVSAETRYKDAIEADQTLIEAYQKLMQVQRKKQKDYLKALIPLDEKQALTALNDYLKTDPEFKDEAQEFYFLGGPHIPFWRELRTPSLPREMSIAEVALLVVFIWMMGRTFWWGTPNLRIGEFSTDKSTSGAGTAFAAELQHQLIDLSSRSTQTRKQVLMVAGPISPLQFGDITANLPIGPSWQSLTKLLPNVSSFFARRSLIVNGLLHDPNDACKGVTIQIQIESRNKIIGKHTLWPKDFGVDTSTDKIILASCAAIWVVFTTQSNPVQWVSRFFAWVRKAIQKPKTILGTSEWEAYAWFFLGDKLYASDRCKAQAAFTKSLIVDPKFLASRTNLTGIYHHQLAEKKTPEEKRRCLDDALEQLEAVQDVAKGSDNPNVYPYLFRKAAILFDRDNLEGKDKAELASKKDLRDALDIANEMVAKMEHERRRLCTRFNRDLMHYLDWRIPVAECMAIGFRVSMLDSSDEITKFDQDKLASIEQILSQRMDFHSLYNLACTYAQFARLNEKPFECDDYRLTLDYLEKSFQNIKIIESLGGSESAILLGRMKDRAKNDASFKKLREDERFQEIVKADSKSDVVKPDTKSGVELNDS